jgi:hypothetical protein
VYTTAAGQVVNGTRGPLGPSFGSVSYQTTIGASAYNALEASVQHESQRLRVLVSYTYSKSLDLASNFGEQVYPSDPKLLRGLSSFDMKHNFTASYSYVIPFESLFRAHNRWTADWSISGITRFTTGFPVTLMNPNDTSLIGTFGNGITRWLRFAAAYRAAMAGAPTEQNGCARRVWCIHEPGDLQRPSESCRKCTVLSEQDCQQRDRNSDVGDWSNP